MCFIAHKRHSGLEYGAVRLFTEVWQICCTNIYLVCALRLWEHLKDFFVQLTEFQNPLLFCTALWKTIFFYLFCKLGGFDLYERCRHGLQVTALIVEGDTSRTWAPGGELQDKANIWLNRCLDSGKLKWTLWNLNDSLPSLVQLIQVHVAPSYKWYSYSSATHQLISIIRKPETKLRLASFKPHDFSHLKNVK